MSAAVQGNGATWGAELCFDFVDPEPPLCGMVRLDSVEDFTEAEALLLTPDATMHTALSPAEIRVDDDGTEATIAVGAEGGGFEAEFARLVGVALGPESAFSSVSGMTLEAFAARADGRWRADGSEGEASGIGRVLRTSGAPDWEQVGLVRLLTVALEDASVLAVAAARPAGAEGHDAEAVSAVLAETDGSVTRFEDPLVSTEYDQGGAQRRVGVELWPAGRDAVAVRGAGSLVASKEAVAFLRFALDGRAGTARYEILRSP